MRHAFSLPVDQLTPFVPRPFLPMCNPVVFPSGLARWSFMLGLEMYYHAALGAY